MRAWLGGALEAAEDRGPGLVHLLAGVADVQLEGGVLVQQVEGGQTGRLERADQYVAPEPPERPVGGGQEGGERCLFGRAELLQVGGQIGRAQRLHHQLAVQGGHPVDQLAVVHVAGVQHGQALGRRDRGELAELVQLRGEAQQAVLRPELGQRERADVALHRPELLDQPQHLVVVQGQRLDAQVVDAQEGPQPARVTRAEAHQPAAQPVAQRVAGLREQLVLVERLAAGGRAQLGGVDHAADEERPVREQPFGSLGQQHLLQVDPVRGRDGRVRGHRQHERDAAQAGLGRRDVDDVERGEAEDLLAVLLQPHPAARVALALRSRPRRRAAGQRRAVDRDGEGELGAVVAGQLGDGRPGDQVLDARAGTQRDGGAGLRALPVGGRERDGVAAVGAAVPEHGGLVAAPGADLDLVGDHEAGEQADAELADELVPGEAEFVALGAAADGRQQLVDLLLAEADAVVLDPQRAVPRQLARGDGYPALVPGVFDAHGGDRVHRVLQQLAAVDLRAGVEVMAQQIDDPAQIDAEGFGHGVTPGARLR